MERRETTIRVSVHDDDPELPVLVVHDLSRPGGLGVRLIDLLAEDWGVTEIAGDGKRVWFEVDGGPDAGGSSPTQP